MTTTAPPERPPSAPPFRTGRILLFPGLPLLVLAVVVAGLGTAIPLLGGSAFSASFGVAAADLVRVDATNARFDITPATDGRVSVEVRGSYSFDRPRVAAETAAGETAVTGGCRQQWFARCALHIAMAVPAATELVLTTTNGAVAVRGLSGAVDLRTDNGGLRLRDLDGDIPAVTTNGTIAATGTTARQVSVRTTNGGVDYFLHAGTTNGTVRDDLPSDRTSDRAITATTTNGDVTVERSAR